MRQKVYSFAGLFILILFLFPAGAFAEKELVIDPGHGGVYTGTCGYTKESPKDICERDVTLAIGLKLSNTLSNSGIKVVMTRNADVDFSKSSSSADLAGRMKVANGYASGNNDNSIFLSIHENASPTSPYAKGLETYYYDYHNLDPDYPYDPLQIKYLNDSKRFAETIHSNVLSGLGLIDRKIHNDQSFYVIRNAQMPSVLVELGYMTNRDEESRILSSAYQQQAAQSIANAVIAYFKVFDVYQNDNKAATFTTKDEAVAFAQKQSGNVKVFDKDAQQFVWENSNYDVYSKINGLVKSFATQQDAIAYAQNITDTRVVEKASDATIWSNFFLQKFTVQTSDGTNTQFFDVNKAIEFAQSKQNSRVLRNGSSEIVWTNVPGEQPTRNLQTSRIAGLTRYSTSVSISKALYPNSFADINQSKTVILATGNEPADALSSGSLAARYGNAPILLNNSTTLLPEVRDELTRLGATKVVIIGGPVAISLNVENAIKSLGIQTDRIYGENRLDTNIQIVDKLGTVNGVFVASARNFPDALAAAPIAAANNWAIILTEQNRISDAALQYIKDKKVVILGGPVAISDNVQSQILQQNGAQNVERLSGADRYDTLANLLWYFKDSIKSNTINVATGGDFPDALAAAPLSIQNKAPLILVGNGLNKNVESFLYKYTEENLINKVNVIGGPVAVSDSIQSLVVDKAK
ncbi:cell wall-binding repeat-containing protein [Bacillus sp. EB600]|uniref:cell wall-binding repeat-containing protein n=1 Tax=Bacillus sp. EB600 TaxID=2806345 RepID=UPI00210C5DDA|nr:cell wall-binding repeat-containing protein [Bacillus sp. EB600]MCQ6278657.1 cell wall-binding repeat-containing protein [Bacillus sp. EB600]